MKLFLLSLGLCLFATNAFAADILCNAEQTAVFRGKKKKLSQKKMKALYEARDTCLRRTLQTGSTCSSVDAELADCKRRYPGSSCPQYTEKRDSCLKIQTALTPAAASEDSAHASSTPTPAATPSSGGIAPGDSSLQKPASGDATAETLARQEEAMDATEITSPSATPSTIPLPRKRPTFPNGSASTSVAAGTGGVGVASADDLDPQLACKIRKDQMDEVCDKYSKKQCNKRKKIYNDCLTYQAELNDAPDEAPKNGTAECKAPESGYTPTFKREMACMVCNCFYEANQETNEGKEAVGRVVWTRTMYDYVKDAEPPYNRRYSPTLCGAIYDESQFSWTNKKSLATSTLTDKKMTDPKKPNSTGYKACYDASLKAMKKQKRYAIHYHATSVTPSWSKKCTPLETVDKHIFYKDCDAQKASPKSFDPDSGVTL